MFSTVKEELIEWYNLKKHSDDNLNQIKQLKELDWTFSHHIASSSPAQREKKIKINSSRHGLQAKKQDLKHVLQSLIKPRCQS